MVDDSEYGIMASNGWQTRDKVHTDLLKGECLRFSSDTVKWGFSRMGDSLVLLADGASFNVICDPLFHSRPLGALTCLPKGFVSSRVSSGGMVVVDGH